MIVSIGLTCIAALLKAYMDYLQFSNIDSWRNKYKNGDPKQGEKFPLSTTVLVSLTDPWHRVQSLFLTTMFALIVSYTVYYSQIVDFLILRVIFGVVFEVAYRDFRKL